MRHPTPSRKDKNCRIDNHKNERPSDKDPARPQHNKTEQTYWASKATQFSSVVQSCLTLYDPMDYSTPCLPVHHQLLELTQTHIHWVSDAIQPSHPLLSPSPSTLNHSQHQVSSNESVLRIWWPKYWSFSFSISPSNEYSGLISFRMDWLDHLAVQGTLKSLLQHHSSKALILQWSAFFIVQLSHPYWKLSKNCIKNNKTTNQILKWRKKYMNRHFLKDIQIAIDIWKVAWHH